MARFLVKMWVEVDDEDVEEDSESGQVFCGTTGESYDSYQEFFEHQLDRDLQCMTLDTDHPIEVKKHEPEVE